MQSISKLCDKCKNCKYIEICNSKRMVACGMAELKPKIMNTTTTKTMPFTQSALREQNTIKINMGEYGTIYTSHEEIAGKLKKEFHKSLNCSFTRKL